MSIYLRIIGIKKDSTRVLIKTYIQFIDLLPKEIYLIDNAEMELILKQMGYLSREFIRFLNWVFIYRNENCKFTPSFRIKQIKQGLNYEDELYTPEQLTKYILFAKDIKTQTLFAIKSYKYCLSWLFVLLHLTNAWRREDFFKIPNIQSEEIGIFNLSWFRTNTLTAAQSIKIILQVRRNREQLIAGKTNAFLHFFCNEDMLIPLASALVIAELHRRERKNDSIFTDRPNDFNLLDFSTRGKLPKFLSRKMNSTIMTYVTTESDFIGIGLIIAQNLRSHSSPNSTQVYIKAMHKDDPINKATLMLFNRGHFGWLYDCLLNILVGYNPVLYGIEDKVERTKEIQLLSKVHTPLQIELTSEFILQQNNRKKSLISELTTISRDQLKKKLIAIYDGHMPARLFDAQCLIYPDCKNPTASTCIYCKYIIPRQFLLASASDEMKINLQKLLGLNENHHLERVKYSSLFIKCMDIISQGIESFSEDYVTALVDYKEINALIEVCSKKFLFLEEIK